MGIFPNAVSPVTWTKDFDAETHFIETVCDFSTFDSPATRAPMAAAQVEAIRAAYAVEEGVESAVVVGTTLTVRSSRPLLGLGSRSSSSKKPRTP